jgi:hypothetical protein
MSLFQECDYVDHDVFVKIFNIYTTSFYGSCLGTFFQMIVRSFTSSMTIRDALYVDRCIHKYLVESISNTMHPKTMLASRYVTFYKALTNSTKLIVRFLASLFETDQRTLMGRTLDILCRQLDISDPSQLSSCIVKRTLKYSEIPEEEKWRTSTVTELLKLRSQSLSLPGLTQDEIDAMLVYTCTT